MIGYIYLTTDLLNGRKYIGKHKAKKFEPHRYLGSNKHLKARISKYGKENFACEMLQECFTLDELNEAEKYWIAKYDAFNSEEFYNLALGGEGGSAMFNRIRINNGIIERRIYKDDPIPEGFVKGRLYQDSGAKISAAKKGKPSKNKGKIWINNGIEQTMADTCPEGWMEGRLHFNRTNLILYNNGLENKYFSEDADIPEGYIKGAIPGTRDSNNRGRVAYNNGIDHIYLKPDQEPPDGYIKGYSRDRNLKNSKSSKHQNKGKHCYNNGVCNRYFSDEETIPEGWIKGGLSRK